MNEKYPRREFIRRSLASGAALSIGQVTKRRNVNEKIGVAFIGVGGQGQYNLTEFIKNPLCRVVALCDVYGPNLQKASNILKSKVALESDFRRLLDRKEVDAVIISTPDHWHALPAVMACKAGKDVYVEKPLALTIAEGHAIMDAAGQYGRVVQVGMQQRSGSHFQEVVETIRSGTLGKVSRVETWVTGGTKDLGYPPDQPSPADLDWEMWLGPAAERPYNPARCLYNFRWFWDYAGGQMSNWGVHLLDIGRWAMDVKMPTRVTASGGIRLSHDCRETPDTLDVTFSYPGVMMSFHHRLVEEPLFDGEHSYGIRFVGENGVLFVDREGWHITPPGAKAPSEVHKGSDQHPAHVRNFLECVHTRKKTAADVETGHTSSAMCHLGNLAYRYGGALSWDEKTNTITDNPRAAIALSVNYREPWRL